MKVALYHNLPAGGARRLLHEFLRRSSATHEYHLFHPSGDDGAGPVVGTDHDLGSVVHTVHQVPMPGSRPARLVRNSALRRRIDVARVQAAEHRVSRVINGGGFDLALVHPCQLTHAPSLLRRLEVPTLYYLHEIRRSSFEAECRPYVSRHRGLVRPLAGGARRLFESELRRRDRRAVAAATALACNSVFTQESVYRAYGRDAVVCHPGVDSELFRPADPGRAPVHGEASVLLVGALDPVKGADLAVAALGLLPAGRRPTLDLVAEREVGGLGDELQALADRNGVKLRVHRRIPDDELVGLYRAADLTLCAARLEPFGLTALESLSTGTPVVATCEGGYRETVVDGVNGYLVERRAAAVADAIDSVLEGRLGTDPQAIRATVVARWSWETSVERLHRAFDAVVRGAP